VTPRLTLTDAPGRDAEHVIESGLARSNEEQAGFLMWEAPGPRTGSAMSSTPS
jgi:hypothetical protein